MEPLCLKVMCEYLMRSTQLHVVTDCAELHYISPKTNMMYYQYDRRDVAAMGGARLIDGKREEEKEGCSDEGCHRSDSVTANKGHGRVNDGYDKP